ncbi:acetyl esterase/lipase [Nonomuraea thailandensis]|uniref:Acetyl esterase/lipase n=1 Tax=Nonomuraea thailandensis TaxID=1188745 RepID=A0A9X2K1B5_9ACTN|nr:alpha/beta hydrolase [Nonomuraea thailandensis]MCP2357097.1 acetyl esterase/lipase [Nonomuraea thailandensis]
MTDTGSVPARVTGPPPPFDAELAAGLAVVQGGAPVTLTPDLIGALRTGHVAAHEVDDDGLRRGGAYTFADHVVPGPPGAPEVTVLVCTPATVDAPAPVIYHIHDGGMVAGTRRSGMTPMLDLAEPHGAIVVSVEYRLAPEHPYPAQLEDCYAGLSWIAGDADALGADTERIVIVGVSAGGGLAAAVALLARDRGGPALYGQLLGYPMLDDRNDSYSTVQMRGFGVWDQTSNETGWRAVLGAAYGAADVSPYAAPARATDLSGLPPAYIDVGSAEIFRDEAVAYADRIWQAGGDAELHVWPGGFHAFDAWMPQAALSQSLTRARQDWLRRLLAT